MNLSLVQNVEIEGIDRNDYPDFTDAYISFATYNGYVMTDEALEELNQHRDFVYETILNQLY